MNKSILKKNSLLKIINNMIISLPSPLNISIWWNFGSILGMMLMIQIITGLFLSMHYCASITEAFNSMINIMKNTNYGWILRLMHMNGASFFFIALYMHIARGLYYMSYTTLKMAWTIGVMIFLLTMMTAFMGYVLPWGQMSFWGATVITNLVSTIPYIGNNIVIWIWGGFSIENPTLNRFFSLHFIMPFIIMMMVIIHLMFIHEKGSNNPLGTISNLYKIKFHPHFSWKDILGFIMILYCFFMLTLVASYKFSDPENFMMANFMVTPPHIQPEWYFLFAYTILRSIPNKLGGVIALLMSILIWMMLPMMKFKTSSLNFYPINQLLFWMLINNFIMLTWLGQMPIELPYSNLSKILTLTYFSYFISLMPISKMWNNKIFKLNYK